MQVPTFAAGTPRNGPAGWWATWNHQVMQDYRAFAPVHRGSSNILFADMSVRSFKDQNNDGFLNNGFPASAGSFASDTEEIPEKEVEGHYSLKDRPLDH